MSNSEKFAHLLAEGISEIQRYESVEGKKRIQEIHEELGKHIGRKAGTIQYFRQGNIPASLAEIEALALEISRRGHLDSKWIADLFAVTDHPNPSMVLAQLKQPGGQDAGQKQKPAIYLNSPTTVSELRALSDQQRHDIFEAQAVDAVAINMWRFLPSYQDEFLAMLKRGGILRFLLVHYNSPAINMAALRSQSQTPAETQAHRVRQNLELLAKWKRNVSNANIQVRLIDYLPPYGITVTYPKDERHVPYCLVRLNSFRSPTSLAPAMTPDPLKDKYWFDFFCEQFRLMWEAGEQFDLTSDI